MGGEIYDSLYRRIMDFEGNLTVKEVQKVIENIQYKAVGHELQDVGYRNWESAVDDLCRMIIWLCDDSGHRGPQEYLTHKLASVAGTLNV